MKKVLTLLLISIIAISAIFSAGTKENYQDIPIHVYAGAGMSKPVKKLVAAFEESSNCKVDLTLANFGQIVSQINNSGIGDVFICASKQDLEVIKDIVTSTDELAQHKVVFAVQKDNPKNIKSLNDLTREDVTLVLGNSSTIAGKMADKILKDLNLNDKVNIIARQTTAATIYTALERGECDAMINWKNNAGKNSLILNTDITDKYTQIICAAGLKYSKNDIVRNQFINFLKSEEAITIWENEGYEIL